MNIFKLQDLLQSVKTNSVEIDKEWVPARPVGYKTIRNKLRALYLVLTNKADVVIWQKGQ